MLPVEIPTIIYKQTRNGGPDSHNRGNTKSEKDFENAMRKERSIQC